MTFLNPAVLFGLLAASIPVLIHLLNLRKLKKIEFSTLVFLKELQKNKLRKIKLKQWLLLLLRTLIVIFLVLAFARPTIKNLALAGAASSVKTSAVFIIDDTFSMSAVEENGSLFNQSRQLLLKHIASLQEGDDAAIIKVSEPANKSVQLTANLKSLSQAADEASVSDVSGTLNEALIKAAALLGTSNNFNKEIYIFSDMQKSALIKDSLYTDLSEFLGERVNIYLFPFNGRQIDNLCLDSLHVNSAVLQKDKTINVSAYIHNYSNRGLNNPVVSLFINGERMAQKVFAIGPNGYTEVTLEAVIKHSGPLDITASLEDDAINADNRLYTTVTVPEKISIGVFEKQKGDAAFLRYALQSDDSLKTFSIDVKPLSMLAGTNPERYQVIFIAGADAAVQTDRLSAFVKNGGSVMLIPGSTTTMQEFASLCGSLGIPSPASLAGSSADSPSKVQFSQVDFEHPMLKGIFRQGEKKAVESPDISKYFSFSPTVTGKTIIKLNSNEPFLTEYKNGKGKYLVISSALLPQWNNLPLKAFFIPLVFRSVYYLSSQEAERSSFCAGDKVALNLRMGAGKQIKIVRPGMMVEALNIGNTPGGTLEYKNTGKQGNYKIMEGNSVLSIFPVNHNPIESDPASCSASDFHSYLERVHSKAKLHEIGNMNKSLDEVKQARFGSELWKWFIIMAIALAVIEMWIARNTKKDLAMQ